MFTEWKESQKSLPVVGVKDSIHFLLRYCNCININNQLCIQQMCSLGDEFEKKNVTPSIKKNL